MARLALSFLGPFAVTLDGVPVTAFDSNKVRALLAYLAVESDRPHSRDALAGLLWPDYPERSARTNLRNALANLRKAVGDQEAMPPYLTVTREAVQFNRQSDCWSDVDAFTELADRESPSDLEGALALYRGPFLEGLSVGDSAAFEDWSFRVREQMDRQVTSTLARLATQYEERAELERALAYARRQVELAPWQEEAHRTLMRLLAGSGQRSAALAQYEACCRALREELDVEPGEETTRLYEQIRDGQDLTGCRWESGGKPVRSAKPSNLPVQLTPFVGREDVLVQIGERLQDPNCRLLTLVGPGGSGKTRLALEAAARQVERYPHGVWFVPLAPLRAVESIVPTIAASLGFTFHGETEPKVQLLDYLRGKDLLLVLDNAEHLIQEPLAGVAGIAAEILKAAPGVEVLVTSRAGLHVQGEHRYPIEGMAYPESAPSAALSAGVCPSPEGETGKLDEAAQYSAIKLFLEAAQRAQPDFQLTDEILPDVVHICQLVEGMPLGILLAAAWVRLLAPAEIAAEIGRSLDFLESDERDVPDRQHSLRAAFDHSWHLLSEREQETFAALSIFRGSFTRDAAQEVTGASPRELLALVDKSLLHRTAEGRYEVHELLQQYAAERRATSPKEEWAIRDRHAAYYAAALERWASDLKSSQQQIALAEMEAEIEDARAAWDWAVEQGQMDRLAQAMEALGWFYDWRVRYLEGASAFRTASEALAAVAKATLRMPDEDLHAWAGVLAWRGLFELRLGQTEHSRECLGHAIDLLKCPLLADQDTRRAKAFLLWATGEAAFWSGDRREAREQYVESLALYRALSDDWGTANALHGLAWIEQSLGAFDNARQFAQDALSLRRALGAARGIAESLRHLGWVFQNLGLFEEAERLERESIALARETNDRPMLAEGLSSLASTLGWQGALAESLSVHEECLALCDDLGDAPLRALTTGLMGYVKAALGQYKEGRRDIERGLVLARETDSKWGTGIFLLFQGMVAATQERYVEAQRCLQESVAVLRASGQRSDVGWSLAALGAVESRLGQADQGRAHVCESLRIALDIRDALTVRFALPFAALLLADLGQVERAVEIHALVSAFPAVANSRMWKDGAGRQITTAAASLPPEVVAAAQERGRARDLWATVEELLVELEEMESESR